GARRRWRPGGDARAPGVRPHHPSGRGPGGRASLTGGLAKSTIAAVLTPQRRLSTMARRGRGGRPKQRSGGGKEGMAQTPEVLLPTSEREAIDAFGDGGGVTVIGGGTVVVPDMTHGRRRPSRALMLGRAGLAGIEQSSGGTITIGAMTTVEELT